MPKILTANTYFLNSNLIMTYVFFKVNIDSGSNIYSIEVLANRSKNLILIYKQNLFYI